MNYSEYLSRVVQLVSLNQKNGQPMTAAVLGSYLSSSIPEVSFKDFGKRHRAPVTLPASSTAPAKRRSLAGSTVLR